MVVPPGVPPAAVAMAFTPSPPAEADDARRVANEPIAMQRSALLPARWLRLVK
jgi:hypothetical protein